MPLEDMDKKQPDSEPSVMDGGVPKHPTSRSMTANQNLAIPADVLGAVVAGMSTTRGTFDGILSLGQDVSDVVGNIPGLAAPWKSVLETPRLMATPTKEARIAPIMFSANGKHLVAGICHPNDGLERNYGLVVWSLQRDCSYVMHSVATMDEDNSEWDPKIRIPAYAMPSDSKEVVLSDTCCGLARLILSDDDSLHGTIVYIEASRTRPSPTDSVNCMVFTKSGAKLITGKVDGTICIRDRYSDYQVMYQFKTETCRFLSCITVGMNDTQLALASFWGKVELWDIASGTMTFDLRVWDDKFNSLILFSNLHYSPNSCSIPVLPCPILEVAP